jgi:hypothetical protein
MLNTRKACSLGYVLFLAMSCSMLNSNVLTAEVCQQNSGDGGHHSFGEEPLDMGSGFVLYEGSFSYEGNLDHSLRMIHCQSGKSIAAATFVREGQEIVVDDVKQEAKNFLIQAVSSDETFSLSDLRAGLSKIGAKAKLDDEAATKEVCGCALFYPTLRGDKEPYEARI